MMTAKEIRNQIIHLLESVDEKKLKNVLDYLKLSTEGIELDEERARIVAEIFREDDNLFRRLSK